jgi:hypothetical protein
MTSEKVVVNNSFPVLGLLGATLVVLKALGYVSWPWVWVLAPFWIPFAILGGFLVIAVLAAAVTFVVAAILEAVKN